MPLQKTFTKTVQLPKRDPAGNIEPGPDNKPQYIQSLGEFTFRRPTVWDLMQIGVRKVQNRSNLNPANFDLQTNILADVYSILPAQVEKAPEGWDWAEQYNAWVMVAIYHAYSEGLAELEEKDKSGSVGPQKA